MEFDPNLVIHLHWRGAPIRNLGTKVIYNPNGLSHFDMLRDNARLSGVYARALMGMLLRSPSLLARHFTKSPAS
jgi:hypothetical protein